MMLRKALAGITALAMTAALTVNMTAYDFDPSKNTAEVSVEPKATEAEESEDFQYDVMDDGTVAIVKYCGSDEEVVIPNEFDGKQVTKINDRAFYSLDFITSVTIPETVKEIGGWTFEGCSSLTSVNIPDGVTEIGEATFKECHALTEVELPQSLTKIGDLAFCYCESLKSIVLPNSLKEIGQEAFFGCTGLTSLDIPSSMTEIGFGIFSSCTSLTDVVIPDSVTALGPFAFAGCNSLAEIELPDSVTSIGSYAFADCTALKKFTIPAAVTEVGHSAFSGCTALTGIDVSEGNKYYDTADGVLFNKDFTEIVCYPDAKKGTTYTIPSTVTKISDWAFSGSKYLTEMDIPEGVTGIGSYAFSGCSVLADISLPDGLTLIGEGAFARTAIAEIEIPGSVKKIESFTFSECKNLKIVDIKDGTEQISYRAFVGCESLTFITIPASVTKLGSNPEDFIDFDPEFMPEDLNEVFLDCSDDLTILGGAGSAAEEYAKEYDISFVPTDINFKFVIPKGSVTLMCTYDALYGDAVKTSVTNNVLLNSTIYNIILTREDGTETQPNGDVVVKISNTMNTSDLCVYLNADSDSPVELKSAVTDKYIMFITDTFGEFTITAEKIGDEEEPETTTATAPTVTPTYPATTTTASEATTTAPEETTTAPETTTTAPAETTAPAPKEQPVAEDENTGVQLLAAEGVLEEGVEIKVVIGDADVGTNAKVYVLDISLVNPAGVNVQPNGSVTVKIPLPETFDAAKTYYVYYRADDGTLTDMHATFADGYVSFSTNHFSTYILSDEKLVEDDIVNVNINTNTGNNTNRNPHTGVILLIVPALAAAAGIAISKKRK